MKKYPEGQLVGMWAGIGIAIFSGAGVPISIATGNSGFIGVSPAIGVAVGIAIGKSIKYRKEGKIRPLTEQEKKNKKLLVNIGLILLALGLIAGLVTFLLRV
jgi:hypothetical protein